MTTLIGLPGEEVAAGNYSNFWEDIASSADVG
jgi:hypothetical protein